MRRVKPVADGGLSRQDAARELLRRRKARDSLVAYSQSIEIPGAPLTDDPDEWLFKPIETAAAKHHVVTMEAIERCIRADFGRLMIFEPPGSAKSTYASVVATTWAMGRFPGLRVLMASYAGTPIVRHSKRARQICASERFRSIWPDEQPTGLVAGSNAADEWELTNGSGLYAAGLMGGITSSRCDLGIIDDPVAGREEAESETMRRKTKAAYEDDFLTRLKPRASIILIQTRWHQDDLAGSILPEDYDGRSGPVLCRDGQVWEILNIPARCERTDDPCGRDIGEYLWPEWFTGKHWAIYEASPRTWSALYQQRPVPETGGQFERQWFKRYDIGTQPKHLNVYGASDYAVSEKRGDFTEHGIVGEDANGDIWVLDWWGGQETSEHTITHFLDLVGRNKPRVWFGERGVIEAAIGPARDRFMREDKQSRRVAIELLPTMGDKIARVASFRARAQLGMVHIPRGVKWADELIEQLCAFPAGRHDDKVDVCGLIGRGIDQMRAARVPESAKRKTLEPFTTEWLHASDARPATKPGYYR